ncbi:MAG: PAS domain S-box protein [Methanosarcinales archaeon]|nr:PAS domain S-box protein [Methanosarcinales archaeon]
MRWWVHEDDTPRAKEFFERTLREGVGGKNFEYKAVRKNGELWYASSSWEPLKDEKGVFKGVVFQTIDITYRKRAEEDLKQTALLLQEHVEKLEEAKRLVEEACSLREHFLKETSHRIITPVAIIGGCAQLLLDSRNLDEDQKKKIRIMQARNAEVQKLVRDALAGKYLEEEAEEGGGG